VCYLRDKNELVDDPAAGRVWRSQKLLGDSVGVEVTLKPLLLLLLTRPLNRDHPGAGAAVQHRRVDVEGQSCDVWSRVREPAVFPRNSHRVVFVCWTTSCCY